MLTAWLDPSAMCYDTGGRRIWEADTNYLAGFGYIEVYFSCSDADFIRQVLAVVARKANSNLS